MAECVHPFDSLVEHQSGFLYCISCRTMMGRVKTMGQYLEAGRQRQTVHVPVLHAPMNTANWQITAAMINRYYSGEKGIYSPCIICGVRFNDCPHSPGETEVVWNMIKNMPNERRMAILKK